MNSCTRLFWPGMNFSMSDLKPCLIFCKVLRDPAHLCSQSTLARLVVFVRQLGIYP